MGPTTGQLGMKSTYASHSGPVDRARVSTLGIHSARPPIRGGKDREEKMKEKKEEGGEKTGMCLNKHVLQERRSA